MHGAKSKNTGKIARIPDFSMPRIKLCYIEEGGFKVKSFIILTTQRTGSTLLWRYLDKHPNISGHGEMFLNSHKGVDTFSTFRRKSLKNRLRYHICRKYLINDYMARFFEKTNEIEACGFKLMYNQLIPELEAYILNTKPLIIHLVRNNALKIVVSRETAKKRNLYHLQNETEIQDVTIRLEPKSLLNDLESIAAEVEDNRQKFSHLPYLELSYESFVKDMTEEAENIFSFLAVNIVQGLPVPLKKINPDSISDLIENYDEVQEILMGTEFESMLDDTLKDEVG